MLIADSIEAAFKSGILVSAIFWICSSEKFFNFISAKTFKGRKIIKILLNNNNINIDGIYTHFSSDVDDYITYYNEKNIFNKYLMLFKFNNVHSAATSSLHKNILGNMVRFGIGLYGYGNYHLKLNPSINFNCNIIKIFNLKTSI